MKEIYVTFQLRSYLNGFGKYAIKCNSEEQARGIALDVWSLHGCKYLYINKCGHLKHGYKVLSPDNYLTQI